MATPTATRVRDIAIAWWQAPGVPRLDALAALISKEFSDELGVAGYLRLAIVTVNSELAVRVTLQRGNNTPVVRLWQPTSGARQENLLDVFDPSIGCTHRELQARPAPDGETP